MSKGYEKLYDPVLLRLCESTKQHLLVSFASFSIFLLIGIALVRAA